MGVELAKRNCIIVTTGYGSISEALCRGALQIFNAEIEGHFCYSELQFSQITKRIKYESIFQRAEGLINITDIFIFLPGELKIVSLLLLSMENVN